MQKSGFPKMRHYVGFWQIGSHILKLVTFTCGIEFYILTITQNVVILIAADIYGQEPTSGEFPNTHLKNSIL